MSGSSSNKDSQSVSTTAVVDTTLLDRDDWCIVIPSHARPHTQVTVHQFPPAIRHRIHLAVYEDELSSYKVRGMGVNTLPVPHTSKGIGRKRAHILRNPPARYVLMFDDDFRFGYRPSLASSQIKTLRPHHPLYFRLVQDLYDTLQRYVHAGISFRANNHSKRSSLEECCRINGSLAYDTQVFEDEPDIILDRMDLMEDFDLTLQLLRAGYPNACLYGWCYDQNRANSPGGCSGTRTDERQREAALQLESYHAPYVRVVRKSSEHWEGLTDRTDVEVEWRAAYESSFFSGPR